MNKIRTKDNTTRTGTDNTQKQHCTMKHRKQQRTSNTEQPNMNRFIGRLVTMQMQTEMEFLIKMKVET